jgi:hypothetical protein
MNDIMRSTRVAQQKAMVVLEVAVRQLTRGREVLAASCKRREAAAQQEAEDETNTARGGGATRRRCNNQLENKRGASRGWHNKRKRCACGLEVAARQEADAG